jgi:S-adenosylmethionine/arginine decarboxylase-like enzyme
MKAFSKDFIAEVGMHVLIEPRIQLGPYGFTGVAGIVTSHIAFHYFQASRTLQFDLYSCRPYDLLKVVKALDRFWKMRHANILFLNRSDTFSLMRYEYKRGRLRLLSKA